MSWTGLIRRWPHGRFWRFQFSQMRFRLLMMKRKRGLGSALFQRSAWWAALVGYDCVWNRLSSICSSIFIVMSLHGKVWLPGIVACSSQCGVGEFAGTCIVRNIVTIWCSWERNAHSRAEGVWCIYVCGVSVYFAAFKNHMYFFTSVGLSYNGWEICETMGPRLFMWNFALT